MLYEHIYPIHFSHDKLLPYIVVPGQAFTLYSSPMTSFYPIQFSHDKLLPYTVLP